MKPFLYMNCCSSREIFFVEDELSIGIIIYLLSFVEFMQWEI